MRLRIKFKGDHRHKGDYEDAQVHSVTIVDGVLIVHPKPGKSDYIILDDTEQVEIG